jgi:hypothetical protein
MEDRLSSGTGSMPHGQGDRVRSLQDLNANFFWENLEKSANRKKTNGSDFYVILFLSNKRWVLGGRWGEAVGRWWVFRTSPAGDIGPAEYIFSHIQV